MNLEDLKSQIPDYAKDTRINLGTAFSRESFPALSEVQQYGLLLATALTVGSEKLKNAVLEAGAAVLTDADIRGAHSAASIMAMNNVYYKSMQLLNDPELAQLPARLRMTVIGNPGISKVDFELYCLAVSAINGCGACLKAHSNELVKHEVSKESIHSAIRIASIVNAAHFVLK